MCLFALKWQISSLKITFGEKVCFSSAKTIECNVYICIYHWLLWQAQSLKYHPTRFAHYGHPFPVFVIWIFISIPTCITNCVSCATRHQVFVNYWAEITDLQTTISWWLPTNDLVSSQFLLNWPTKNIDSFDNLKKEISKKKLPNSLKKKHEWFYISLSFPFHSSLLLRKLLSTQTNEIGSLKSRKNICNIFMEIYAQIYRK